MKTYAELISLIESTEHKSYKLKWLDTRGNWETIQGRAENIDPQTEALRRLNAFNMLAISIKLTAINGKIVDEPEQIYVTPQSNDKRLIGGELKTWKSKTTKILLDLRANPNTIKL